MLSVKLDLKFSSPQVWGRTGFDGALDLCLARTGHTVKIAKTINADNAKLSYSPALLAA